MKSEIEKNMITHELNAVLKKHGVHSGVFIMCTNDEIFQIRMSNNETIKELSDLVNQVLIYWSAEKARENVKHKITAHG